MWKQCSASVEGSAFLGRLYFFDFMFSVSLKAVLHESIERIVILWVLASSCWYKFLLPYSMIVKTSYETHKQRPL